MQTRLQLTLKFVENPNRETIKRVKEFGRLHWGKLSETPSEIRNNYFSKPSIVVTAENSEHNILGGLNIHVRKIKFENVSMVMGGIGAVLVHQDFRHQGIASMLVRNAIYEMKFRNIDFSLLSTDLERLAPLYEKAGFVPLNRPYTFIDKHGKIAEEDQGMIAPVKSTEMFEIILNSKELLNIGESNF